MAVSYKRVNKIYSNGRHAVRDFSLEVGDGEFVCIAGESGCGKSAVLRMTAGFEEISSGELYIDGKPVEKTTARDGRVAEVFLTSSLYPHLTVYENLAFGLTLEGVDPKVIEGKVCAAAEILGLTDCLGKFPRALSGGQCRRVSAGRFLVREAKVFIMDEPLSNFNGEFKQTVLSEIKEIHRLTGVTVLYATRSLEDAAALTDKIIMMKDGSVIN